MRKLLAILALTLPCLGATLQWDASDHATGYGVYSNNVCVAHTTTTSWTLPVSTNAVVWHVTAFDDLSESEPSNKVLVWLIWTPLP